MFDTKINFEIHNSSNHQVNFFYSKWAGKVKISVDGKVIEEARIVFGGHKREYSFDTVLIEVYPGKAFWVKPLVKVLANGKLVKAYNGNNEIQLESIKNFNSEYKLDKPFVEAFKYLKILLVVIGVFFALIGISIIPLTAILHPEELQTSMGSMIGGTILFIVLATILMFISKIVGKTKESI